MKKFINYGFVNRVSLIKILRVTFPIKKRSNTENITYVRCHRVAVVKFFVLSLNIIRFGNRNATTQTDIQQTTLKQYVSENI